MAPPALIGTKLARTSWRGRFAKLLRELLCYANFCEFDIRCLLPGAVDHATAVVMHIVCLQQAQKFELVVGQELPKRSVHLSV